MKRYNRKAKRLYFILYNVLYSCANLGKDFPPRLVILKECGQMFYSKSRKYTKAVANSLLSPQLKRKQRETRITAGEYSRKNNIISTDTSNLKRKRRKKMLTDERSKYDTITAEYNAIFDNFQRDFTRVCKFIDMHTKYWDPNWEELVAIPDLGLSLIHI